MVSLYLESVVLHFPAIILLLVDIFIVFRLFNATSTISSRLLDVASYLFLTFFFFSHANSYDAQNT